MVDRLLSIVPRSYSQVFLKSTERFQLLVVSALYIAIKSNERAALSSSAFAAMSIGMYTKKDIEEMELTILHSLGWRIHAPTSIDIAHHFLSLTMSHLDVETEVSTWAVILDEVDFQVQFAMRDYPLSIQRPSVVALAAIINTFDKVDVDREACQDRKNTLWSVMDQFDSPHELVFSVRDRLRSLIALEGSTALLENMT